jgi:hypothetical protein
VFFFAAFSLAKSFQIFSTPDPVSTHHPQINSIRNLTLSSALPVFLTDLLPILTPYKRTPFFLSTSPSINISPINYISHFYINISSQCFFSLAQTYITSFFPKQGQQSLLPICLANNQLHKSV